ncbi:cupin domain-containing protein [Scytonema sp. UIC 10036]|nr:cupin domain-containing protein [Scytonema sp. UIC 10036]
MTMAHDGTTTLQTQYNTSEENLTQDTLVSSNELPTQYNMGEENLIEDTLEGNTQEPVVLPDRNRPGYWLVGDHATFVATGEDTNGQYSLFDFYTLPQGGPFPHIHRSENEFAYVLEGEISYQLNDEVITATPGTFVYKHQDDIHGFVNLGDTPSRHLEFTLPPGLEEAFATVGVPGSILEPPPNEIPPSEILDNYTEVLAEYGVEAQNSIIFPSAGLNETLNGTPEVTLLRPGQADTAVSATLALSNGTAIPVDFAAGERTKTVEIPVDGSEVPGETLELAITNPTNGAIVGLLQDELVLTFGENNTYTLENGDKPDSFPTILPNDEERLKVSLGNDEYTFVATAADTDGKISLFDVSVGPGTQNESLLSAPTDLGFYVVDGNATFEMGDESFTAQQDTFVFLPEGNPFALTNQGTLPARVLAFSTSPEIEQYIASAGISSNQANSPVSTMEPPLTSDLSTMISTESLV